MVDSCIHKLLISDLLWHSEHDLINLSFKWQKFDREKRNWKPAVQVKLNYNKTDQFH